jgi:hypothetical protein
MLPGTPDRDTLQLLARWAAITLLDTTGMYSGGRG